jgi:hypothetical protein
MIRAGHPAQAEIAWLMDCNFQTEVELGRCLRLPQVGRCACDLYLSCAGFVTMPSSFIKVHDHVPLLRRNLCQHPILIV